MSGNRTKLEQEVVDALLESKAIDFDKLASVLARFGPRAAQAGIPLGVIIGRRVIDACIPPDPFLAGFTRVVGPELEG